MDQKIYYSIKEVADIFSTTRMHIWRMVKQDKINAVKIGNILRIHKTEVERLMEGGKDV